MVSKISPPSGPWLESECPLLGPLCSDFSVEARQKEDASFWTVGPRKLRLVTLQAATSRDPGLGFAQDLGTVEGTLACLFQQSGPPLEATGCSPCHQN